MAEDRRAHHTSPLNWLDDRLTLHTNGHEASSLLTGLGLHMAATTQENSSNARNSY